MWWWQFNKEEPLQEDLMVYEKFIEFRSEREKMNRDKAEQKEKSKKLGSISSTTYKIPDPQ